MAGLLGGIYDALLGPGPPKATASGYFGPQMNLWNLGTDYSQFLRDRLNTPVEKSKEFQYGSEAIRDLLSRSAGAAKTSLGDASRAGGFADSGAVWAGYGDINRAEISSYAEGLRGLIMDLEARRTAEILPFLQGAAGESMSVQQLLSQNLLGERAMNQQITKEISEEARGWVGMFGGGGMGG